MTDHQTSPVGEDAERAAPCPWCGEAPDVTNDASFRLTDGVKYGALHCCVTGPEVRTDYKDVGHWRAAAIAAWNDRVAPTQPKAQVRSIDTPEFRALVRKLLTAHNQMMNGPAGTALIAHIDAWAGSRALERAKGSD